MQVWTDSKYCKQDSVLRVWRKAKCLPIALQLELGGDCDSSCIEAKLSASDADELCKLMRHRVTRETHGSVRGRATGPLSTHRSSHTKPTQLGDALNGGSSERRNISTPGFLWDYPGGLYFPAKIQTIFCNGRCNGFLTATGNGRLKIALQHSINRSARAVEMPAPKPPQFRSF